MVDVIWYNERWNSTLPIEWPVISFSLHLFTIAFILFYAALYQYVSLAFPVFEALYSFQTNRTEAFAVKTTQCIFENIYGAHCTIAIQWNKDFINAESNNWKGKQQKEKWKGKFCATVGKSWNNGNSSGQLEMAYFTN